MLFAGDSYFYIGRGHFEAGKPCQDYALAGTNGRAAYAIVSDGCSTGGKTDVGARILALSTAKTLGHTAVRAIAEPVTDVLPEISVRQRLVVTCSQEILGLSQSDILATCVYCYFTPQGGYIHLEGDGVIALRWRDKHIRMYRYEWEDNRPCYPAFAQDHFAGFIQEHGGDLAAQKLTQEIWDYAPGDTGCRLISETHISLWEGIRGVRIPIAKEELDLLDCVAVFTDGVAQVEGIDWKEAVVECLAFKVVAGEFVKRRLIRFIKDVQKKGKGPLDDIACAAIRMIPEEVK